MQKYDEMVHRRGRKKSLTEKQTTLLSKTRQEPPQLLTPSCPSLKTPVVRRSSLVSLITEPIHLYQMTRTPVKAVSLL